ncbi:MAG: efflux RND transporter periplasmic adaptor subunit [Sulfuricella sp.]|nr:efflux RND transporter periplasmic adaptor subunit [Sulfuricella sp.]
MKWNGALVLGLLGLLPGIAGAEAALHFPAGAPQLNFLRVETVNEVAEPATDPLNGRITYDENHTARVITPLAGRVTKIAVQVGDRVKAGQPLLWITSGDAGGAVADSRKAEADRHLKEIAYQRAKALFEGEVLARKDYEAAEADRKQAEAEAERAHARLRSLAPGGIGADGVFALRAEMAGVIADRQVNPGLEVRPDGATPLAVITDTAHVWAAIDLPERELSKVRVGQPVVVEVDAYPDQRFPGKVLSIGEVLDPASRRVQVRCAVDNPQRLLKPEMFARITPLREPARRVLKVPSTAVITLGLQTFVYVESAPGTFEKRAVVLERQHRDFSVIGGGIKAGERVVSSGALLLNSEATARK